MSAAACDPTELAPPTAKSVRAGKVDFDPADYGAVYALARKMAGARPRRLMGLSIVQLQGLINFAADCGTVAFAAAEMFAASDGNAGVVEIAAAMDKLAAAVRPMMGEEP
jgi:hypothetical protein